MEENKEILELLTQIKKDNSQQNLIGKIRCGLSAVSAVCFLITLILVISMLPRVNGLIGQADRIISQADGIITQANGVMGQMETVLGNLEQTTNQLAEVDLQSMVEDVDSLVRTGQSSLEETMRKLDALDFETLNQAIEDLAAVIEPMAKFANLFSR